MIETKKYNLQDLKLGMQVKLSELQNILDVHMLLEDTRIIDNNDLIGTLVFFGNDEKEYQHWFRQPGAITPVYFDSEELEDGVVYDE